MPGPGFRYFNCDECHYEWILPCRDKDSPSGEPCPKCSMHISAVPASTYQYDTFNKNYALMELLGAIHHALYDTDKTSTLDNLSYSYQRYLK